MKRKFSHYVFMEGAGGDGGQGGGGGGNDDAARWEAKFNAEKSDRIKITQEFSAFKKKFEGFDPEKYAELMKAQEESEANRQKKAGEYEKLETELRKIIAEKDAMIAEGAQRFDDMELKYMLGGAFSKAKGKGDYIPDLVGVARQYMRRNDAGDWEIRDENGGRIFRGDKDKTEVSDIEGLATYIREDTKYGVFFEPIEGKGSGSEGSPTPIPGGEGKNEFEGIKFL